MHFVQLLKLCTYTELYERWMYYNLISLLPMIPQKLIYTGLGQLTGNCQPEALDLPQPDIIL